MINVTQEDDNKFTISWDENDPQEKIFNNWTEEDFINAIQDYLHTLQESGEVDINQVTEAVNHINDYIEEEFIKDPDQIYDNYIQATNQETYGDQGTEQSQTGTVPPPQHFPLFP